MWIMRNFYLCLTESDFIVLVIALILNTISVIVMYSITRSSFKNGQHFSNISDIFDEKTVIVTWDTLHIILTLSIYLTLVIFIWITKLDPCQRNSWHDNYYESEDLNADEEIPRCLTADKAMYA